MEFPLLFALVMLVVAVGMIWSARKRSRRARHGAADAVTDDGPRVHGNGGHGRGSD